MIECSDALKANAICKNYGGKQPHICNSIILNTFMTPTQYNTDYFYQLLQLIRPR